MGLFSRKKTQKHDWISDPNLISPGVLMLGAMKQGLLSPSVDRAGLAKMPEAPGSGPLQCIGVSFSTEGGTFALSYERVGLLSGYVLAKGVEVGCLRSLGQSHPSVSFSLEDAISRRIQTEVDGRALHNVQEGHRHGVGLFLFWKGTVFESNPEYFAVPDTLRRELVSYYFTLAALGQASNLASVS